VQLSSRLPNEDVAQMDRASVSEAEGHRFDPCYPRFSRSPSGKASVCKTDYREFNPHPGVESSLDSFHDS
jgi:hypothetical protein